MRIVSAEDREEKRSSSGVLSGAGFFFTKEGPVSLLMELLLRTDYQSNRTKSGDEFCLQNVICVVFALESTRFPTTVGPLW